MTNRITPSITDPLISVVIPTYDNDPLSQLRQAVESILSQTHTHLELIIVTDGPVPETTTDFLNTIRTADTRVRIIHLPENRGQAHARNVGIKEAVGLYIALLDADDIAHPDRLTRQRAYLEETGSDLVGSFYRTWHGLPARDSAPPVAHRAKQMPVTHEAIIKYLCAFNPIANSTVFAKAAVLKNNPFETTGTAKGRPLYGEDYALWVTLAERGYRLGNIPEALIDFRTGPNFYQRRRGYNRFQTDLRTKLRAVQLRPPNQRPWARFLAIATSIPRLLPAPLLASAYQFRTRLKFKRD